MDREPNAVRVEGSFERSRRPFIVVAIAVGFIALAVLKPWAGWAGHDTAGGGVAIVEATPPSSPSPIPTPWLWDPNAMACMGTTGQQVLTLVRWPGHEVRTWQPATGAVGSDPLDARLVPLRIVSSHVIGLGLCTARQPGDATPSAAVVLDVVSITAGSKRAGTDLGPPFPITQQRTAPDLGFLYGPPGPAAKPVRGGLGGFFAGDSSAPDASPDALPSSSADAVRPSAVGWSAWTVGSYAVSFPFEDEYPDHVRWLRFEIVAAAGEPN